MTTFCRFLAVLGLAFISMNAEAQYKKVWWNPTQNGMGTFIDQQEQVDAQGNKKQVLFGAWFHYDTDTKTAWLTFVCTLSKDTSNRDVCQSQLFRATGSIPMGYDQSRFAAAAVGNITITFASSSSATVTYQFDGQSGTLTWVPQTFGTEYVIAIWGLDSFPYMVTKTTVTKVINRTQFQAGVFPLGNCSYGTPNQPDGKILTQCRNAVAVNGIAANSVVTTYINPNTGEMFDYNGVVPSNVTWVVTANTSDKPEWGAKARIADGWFYTTSSATSVLRFQPDNGASFVVKSGTFATDGDIRAMASYSN